MRGLREDATTLTCERHASPSSSSAQMHSTVRREVGSSVDTRRCDDVLSYMRHGPIGCFYGLAEMRGAATLTRRHHCRVVFRRR